VVWQPIYQVILSKICDVFRNSLNMLRRCQLEGVSVPEIMKNKKEGRWPR
jgi:hypothetical protein